MDGRVTTRVYLSPPHMSRSERALLLDAFDSNWIAPLGPHVDALEEEFAATVGAEHAVALSSGTAALHLALVLLGVGPGDEVLTSTLTFAATANAVTYVGATPVLIDSDRDTWNMDPDLLAAELRACARRAKLPKAVLVVDLYGHCADYEPILAACARYDVPIVEDAAESLGRFTTIGRRGLLVRSTPFRSMPTRSSRAAAAVCSHASERIGPSGPDSWRHRPAIRRPTISIRTSATTTA